MASIQVYSVDRKLIRQVVLMAQGGEGGNGRTIPPDQQHAAITAFAKEVERFTCHIETAQAKMEASATNLIKLIKRAQNDDKNETALKDILQARAKELAQTLLKQYRSLQHDSRAIFGILMEAATSADQVFHDDCLRNLLQEATTTMKSTLMILQLSDIFSLLHQSTLSETWIPPSGIEYKTAKYWVEDVHLDEVMAVTASEIPLLVFGTQGTLSESLNGSGDVLWTQCASQITSVYFDTADLRLYKERLRRSEGAQLLRVRWYGPKPASDTPVFLELKSHNEEWNGVNGIKESVAVLEGAMRSFLSYAQWSRTKATAVLLAASPDMPEEELEHSVNILLKMHELIAKHRMRPCVRSCYSRIVFQSSHSDSLRVKVDQNVTLYDETRNVNHDWCMPDSALETSKHVVIPCAIFEVKQAGSGMPHSITNLIKSGLVVNAYKFSKYLSGAAAFNKVETLPQWANHPKFKSIFLPEARLDTRDHTSLRFLTQNDAEVDSNTKSLRTSNRTKDLAGCRPKEPIVPIMKRRPKLAQRCFSTANKLPSMIFRYTGTVTTVQDIAPSRPARVEPKSFFANERTFVQWVSIALLLATIDSLTPDGGSTFLRGLKRAVLTSVAVMIVYSAAVYYRRLSLMRKGKPYGYADRFGPALLILAVILGITIMLVKPANNKATKKEVSFLKEGPGCFQFNHGLSPFEYEPSDVAVVDGVLLVPSIAGITAITTQLHSTAKHLITIPDTDIEAIAIAEDRMFVVSEGDTMSDLIELSWINGTEKLQEVARWKFELGNVEALAFVPGTTQGQLYFGNDQGNIYTAAVPSQESSGIELPIKALNRHLFRSGLSNPKIASMQYLEGTLYVLHDNAGVVRCWDIATGAFKAEWKLPILQDNFGMSNQIEGFFLERRPVNLRGGQYLMHLAVDTPAQVWTITVHIHGNDHSLSYPLCATNTLQ